MFVVVVAFQNWSTQSVLRGAVAAAAATMVNSALFAAGVSMQTMALFAGPVIEETSRTVAARKDRDFSLAQVVLFAAGFVLVEIFVKVTRRAEGQTLERALAIGTSATDSMALHILSTLILAFAINRSRDLLRTWPIWLALIVMIFMHAAFNLLVFWPPIAGFFGLRAGDAAPFAYVAFVFIAIVCIAALMPRRFAWKWG
jgi:hypothetical protein